MKDIEILDSVIQKEQTFGLKQLSESILVLSDADAIIFAPGWEESRGCRIEHMIAEEFHMHIIQKTKKLCKIIVKSYTTLLYFI